LPLRFRSSSYGFDAEPEAEKVRAPLHRVTLIKS
jgi:hypothetical protein